MSGPLKEPFEIKVYEIDDVERLQRRRQEETTEVSRGSLLMCSAWWFILLNFGSCIVWVKDLVYESNVLSLSNILHM